MGAASHNTLKTYKFVDMSKIVAMGHSMGASIHGFLDQQSGSGEPSGESRHEFLRCRKNQDYNFNFVCIIGDADESTLVRSNNNVASIFRLNRSGEFFAVITRQRQAKYRRLRSGRNTMPSQPTETLFTNRIHA
jgi:hypothetical protein